MPTVRKQYGPTVKCTFTGDLATTHRPGNSGPFFCMNCGETDHPEVDYAEHFAGKAAEAEAAKPTEETPTGAALSPFYTNIPTPVKDGDTVTLTFDEHHGREYVVGDMSRNGKAAFLYGMPDGKPAPLSTPGVLRFGPFNVSEFRATRKTHAARSPK